MAVAKTADAVLVIADIVSFSLMVCVFLSEFQYCPRNQYVPFASEFADLFLKNSVVKIRGRPM